MVNILFINPNSTDSMTRSVVATAQLALPDAKIRGWTSLDGPPSIQGKEDGAAATPPLLSLIEGVTETDAIVIACFDDTALDEAKSTAPCPVIGIGEAAYHAAALRGYGFSVVTTLDVSVPIIEENINAYGFGHRLGRVRASNIPVLEIDESQEESFAIILAESRAAFEEDEIDAVVLGCAGMTGLAEHLRQELKRPIIDGVEAASYLALAMARLDRGQ